MRKLLKGISEFRKKHQLSYQKRYADLHREQRPNALFFACSDSRVVPNIFASTEPGDLFVVRNVGNLVPHPSASEKVGYSEVAAIEFAMNQLSVSDIVVCGHSECGAMKAISDGRGELQLKGLKHWLLFGDEMERVERAVFSSDDLDEVNRFSQVNVLHQIEHLRGYSIVESALREKRLRLHGWWFDLKTANVFSFSEEKGRFVVLDDEEVMSLLEKM